MSAAIRTCEHFLSASRQVARKRKGWTDRACAVLGDGFGGYIVEAYDGTIVWEGAAHCATCARAEAIAANADKVPS